MIDAVKAVRMVADFFKNNDAGLSCRNDVDSFRKSVSQLGQYEDNTSPIVLFWDLKKRHQLQDVGNVSLLELIDSDFENNVMPPPHHAWIYCCSNIQIHSGETAEHLAWISRGGQPGAVVLHGTTDQEQIRKAIGAACRVVPDKTKFIAGNDEILHLSALFDERFEGFGDSLVAATRYAISAYSQIPESMMQLGRYLESMEDTTSHVTTTLQVNMRTLVKRSDEIRIWVENTGTALREEVPDFQWLEAIMSGSPEVADVVEDGIHKTFDSSDSPDRGDVDSGEEDENELNQTAPGIDAGILEGALQEEIMRAIVEHFDYIKPPNVSEREARILQEDSALKIALERIRFFAEESNLNWSLDFEGQPKWSVSRQILENDVKMALKANPMPGAITNQLIRLIVKIRNSGLGIAVVFGQMVIKASLDRWGKAVFLNVVDKWQTEATLHAEKWYLWSQENSNHLFPVLKVIEDVSKKAGQLYEQVSALDRVCRTRPEC